MSGCRCWSGSSQYADGLGDCLAQVRANQALAIAYQATVEATLLVMRQAHASELRCQGEELETWTLDAHGVCDAAAAWALAERHGGAADDGAAIGSVFDYSAKLEIGACYWQCG